MSRGTAHNAYNRARQLAREEARFRPTEAELLNRKRRAKEAAKQEAQHLRALANMTVEQVLRRDSVLRVNDIKAKMKDGLLTLRVKLAAEGAARTQCVLGEVFVAIADEFSRIMCKATKDSRLVLTAITRTPTGVTIDYKETTRGRILASLLANGVPMSEARKIAYQPKARYRKAKQ